jgi:hypothetical protein
MDGTKTNKKLCGGGQQKKQTKIFQKKKAIIHFERVKKQKEASI